MKNDLPVRFYRFNRKVYKLGGVGIKLSILLNWINRFFFSVWIPASCKLGKNFQLGYGGLGVVIHSDTVMGDNCLVAQGVTIGRNLGDKKVPRFGDDCYVGAGSKVFGEITIGNNVIIGANSVVNKSIPDNCTVVGNPMRIIKTDRKETWYQLNNKVLD